MCDLAYTIQREEIIRQALAEIQLAPHVEDAGSITPPDVALAEFEAWLDEQPEGLDQPDGSSILDLLGFTGGRR